MFIYYFLQQYVINNVSLHHYFGLYQMDVVGKQSSNYFLCNYSLKLDNTVFSCSLQEKHACQYHF